MKGSSIKRARAPLRVVAANDNLSTTRNAARASSSNSAEEPSSLSKTLRRLMRPILVAGITAWVVLWMSGAFVVGMAGIAVVAAAFAGWHLLRRRTMTGDGGQRTEL
jgi:hypothetical protein